MLSVSERSLVANALFKSIDLLQDSAFDDLEFFFEDAESLHIPMRTALLECYYALEVLKIPTFLRLEKSHQRIEITARAREQYGKAVYLQEYMPVDELYYYLNDVKRSVVIKDILVASTADKEGIYDTVFVVDQTGNNIAFTDLHIS